MNEQAVTTAKKPTPLYILVPAGLVVLNVLIGIALLISMYFSWEMASFNAVILGIVTVVTAFLYRQLSFTWVALIGVAGGVICGMYAVEFQDIKGREIARNISPADAVHFPEAGGYHFTDASLRTEFTGTYVKKNTDSKGHTTTTFYYAAPVTDKNWNRNLPVMVWAVQGPGDNKENWKKPFNAGIRARKTDREEFLTTVRETRRQYNLTSNPKAILIHWVASPETAAQDYLAELVFALVFWNISWLVGLVGARIYLFFKRKKTPPPTPKKIVTPTSPDVLFRFIFSVYCFIALEFSIFFSKLEMSLTLAIFALVVAIVFFIVASASLHIAHRKDGRPVTDLLWMALYPYAVYGVVFLSFDVKNPFFWLFPGYFYFLTITGGFMAGIFLSPFMAGNRGESRQSIMTKVKAGFAFLKNHGKRCVAGVMFLAVTVVLVFVFLRLLSQMAQLSAFQVIGICLFLFAAILAVSRFTYRHTHFNIARDPRLKKKYASK